MHCYDLNWIMPTYPGANAVSDDATLYPALTTPQNEDINQRAWVWGADNYWKTLVHDNLTGTPAVYTKNEEIRYSVEPGVTNYLPGGVSSTIRRTKVYRNWIDIQYMLYGATSNPVEYDVRVIKIMDPRMCPDYEGKLEDVAGADETELTDFQQNWQNLIYGWTNNPMLRGIEPQPRATKRWFRTVAKKKVIVGERTTDVETVPVVKGSIRVALNEMNTLTWGNKGYSMTNIDTNQEYDDVPNVDDLRVLATKERPYYTSRYYLLIRASDYVVNDNSVNSTFVDNRNPIANHGSYDLIVRTKFTALGF